MDSFSAELNHLLKSTYRSVTKLEEQMLKSNSNLNLSITELHIIEFICSTPPDKTISSIAQEFEITLPSVTAAINKLIKKGYVEKIKNDKDARVVFVKATPLGEKVNRIHDYFHQKMVRNVAKEIEDEEKEILLKAFKNLNIFFSKNVDNLERKNHK